MIDNFRVFVASAYAPDTWNLYRAQRWFLDQTTTHYRQLIVSPQQPPVRCEWQQPYDVAGKGGGNLHIAALKACVDWFVDNRGHYDLGLICDSDAFPIRAGWAQLLRTLMLKHGKLFAAPVRTENLDLFPHIAFTAFLPEGLRVIRNHLYRGTGPTLLRTGHVDPCATLPAHKCFPLLKSNSYSPHPTQHIVYGDVAYHLVAGSRKMKDFALRNYWSSVLQTSPVVVDEPITPSWINRLLGMQRFADCELPRIEDYQR